MRLRLNSCSLGGEGAPAQLLAGADEWGTVGVELSYSTTALQKICLGLTDSNLEESMLRELRAIVADLRAARTFADAPLAVEIQDEELLIWVDARTAVRATVGHVIGRGAELDNSERIKLLSIENRV